jgi:hypothetical protein
MIRQSGPTGLAIWLRSIVVLVLGSLVSILICLFSAGGQTQPSGALTGRVHVLYTDGVSGTPNSALIYVIYAAGPANDYSEKTAGSVYESEQVKIAKTFVKETAKDGLEAGTEPEHQRQQLLEMYMLETVDGALKATEQWARKHKAEWQFMSIKVLLDGTWSAHDLRPGHYKVIARGHLDNIDAEWEASIQIKPGETVSVDLAKPNMAHELPTN